MTTEDTKALLMDIDAHAERLDRQHVKQLYNLLMSVCNKEHTVRDDVHKIIAMLISHAGQLTKQNIKKLYKIAIRYDLNPKCFACNQPILNIKDFSWDHLYPHSKGGSDDLHNLVPMHKSCNQEKGNNVFEIVITSDYVITFDEDAVVITVPQPENTVVKKKKTRNVMRFRPWQYETSRCRHKHR